MKDHKKYYELLNSYLNNTESLILESIKKLYSKCGVDPNNMEANEQRLIESGKGQQMMMSQSALRQKVK